MGIFFLIEDQYGERLSDVIELERLQRHFPRVEGSCLRFVSDDDDARFNRAQAEPLLAELKALDASISKKEERDELERLTATIERHLAKKRVYSCFYGEDGEK
jgi:hypothetical protein